MQTVLVTGGAGFIGSHLCKKLISDGYKVICVDNFLTGNKENIKDLLNNPNFTFIKFDVIETLLTNDHRLTTIDFIFHLASPASPNEKSPRSYIAHGIETLRANSEGTRNLLELARKNNARFLFASTSEVYGDPLVSPQPETYWGNVNPNGIRSVYDEAKRYGEAIVMAYKRKFNLDMRVVRIFNTYGPNMQVDDGRVVSNFIVAALKNKPLTIYGDGRQTRSFCYISDLVEGLIAFMFHKDLEGEVINMGNPNEQTIIKFAKVIQTLTNTSSKIVYESLPQDDPKKRNPDITKARKLLEWEPKVSLEDGLKKTIDYFKNIVK